MAWYTAFTNCLDPGVEICVSQFDTSIDTTIDTTQHGVTTG